MSQVKVGDYLFQRLRQIGIKSIFGVPGDFELALLDLIPKNGLTMKSNPNELVASYAADGYARVKEYGAFVTTFGPGELSAYCGMAGQYAEFVPVVHIVGYPPVTAQKAGLIMHHTLGNGKFDMYHKMSSQITTATTVLNDADVAAAEIDRVLNTMIFDSRPVYIGVPTDIAYEPISDKGLQQSLTSELPLNDPSLERKVLVELRSWMETKARPVLIMDGNAVRNHCVKEVNELARLTGFPICVTVMGKGGANEALPNFGGVYSGAGSHPQVKKAVETSDALFWFGSFLSDFNTGEFTAEFDRAALIDFQRFFVKIADQQFDVKMKYLLQALIKDLKETPLKRSTESRLIWEAYPNEHIKFKGPLTQDFLWHTLGDFFEKGDYIIAENGTSSFGSGASKLPEGAFMYNQTIFGSIGYATGAAVGSCQAIKEVQGDYKRGVLVTGEGSFHMTVQAVADMLRFDLKPIIFILNNGGYTVERLIHGRTAEYNDVALYDYSALAQTFGPAHKSQYFGPIKTAEELVALIKNPKVRGNDCFTIIELALDPFDAPFSLLKTGAAVDEFNKRHDQKHPAPRVQG